VLGGPPVLAVSGIANEAFLLRKPDQLADMAKVAASLNLSSSLSSGRVRSNRTFARSVPNQKWGQNSMSWFSYSLSILGAAKTLDKVSSMPMSLLSRSFQGRLFN
jgi:hypothetical protein